MPDVICQVVKKFSRYNVGERIGANESQVKRWVSQGVVVKVPGEALPAVKEESKAETAPPIHKMVTVADEAKASDDQPARRGRPSRG